jgi:Leucine-rich repeat (LRR) protein
MDKKELQMGSWYPAKVAFLLFISLALLWVPPQSAAGQAKPGTNTSQTAQGTALSAEQVLADPGILHQRLKLKNPEYNGQAQFASDPALGLAADFTGSKISDLSGLAGIPFNALDLRGQPVSDLKPLKGMPLRILGIEDTRVADLSPVKGMKLEKLYLNNAPITDLRPLNGMPLKELMLAGIKVKDLKPLHGAPLQELWLNDTPVSDISLLIGCPMKSLTLEGTKVADLRPLSRMTSLKRLHIGNTPVSDLSPLKTLKLERLIFTPRNIRKGLDVVRNMKTLMEVGTTLETRMPPEQFWSRYDRKKGE